MRTGVFLLTISIILCISGWLDRLLSAMRLKKDYTAMTLLSCLLLNNFLLMPLSEFEINPSVLLLSFIMLLSSLQLGEYSLFISLLCKTIFTTAIMAVLFIFPKVPLYVIMIPASLLIGILFIKRPIFAANLCSTLPLSIYMASLFTEALFYIPYSAPNMADTFDAQAVGLLFSFFVSYVARIFISHKKSERNI